MYLGGFGNSVTCDMKQLDLVHCRYTKNYLRGFPDGSVVKNLPANTEDTGLIPDPGRSRMPQKQLDPRITSIEPVL